MFAEPLLATIFPLILNTFNWNCLENNGWFHPSNPKSDRGNRTQKTFKTPVIAPKLMEELKLQV